MVGMDVETSVREEIPILTILLNNSAMGNYEKHIPRSSATVRHEISLGQTTARWPTVWEQRRGASKNRTTSSTGPSKPRSPRRAMATSCLRVHYTEEPDMAIG